MFKEKEIVFTWKDPKGPFGTLLTVRSDGLVNYSYAGSWENGGSKDASAVLRSVKAFKAWGNPEGLPLKAVMTDRRHIRLYRRFGVKVLC